MFRYALIFAGQINSSYDAPAPTAVYNKVSIGFPSCMKQRHTLKATKDTLIVKNNLLLKGDGVVHFAFDGVMRSKAANGTVIDY